MVETTPTTIHNQQFVKEQEFRKESFGDKLKNTLGGNGTHKKTAFTNTVLPPQNSTVRTEKPVLDKVEKLVHREIVEKPRIIEDHERELIEVHEQPIQKRVMHPAQEMHIRESERFETSGRETADLEKQRILEEMRLKDRSHHVSVKEHQDVHVTHEAPTYTRGDATRKEVIQKPIVTEVHEQPIIEVHEQDIHKRIYEKPIVTVVREKPIIESTTSVSQPLTGLERSFHQMNVVEQPVPVVQKPALVNQPKPIIKEVVKEVPVQQPMTVSTSVVEKHKGMPPRVREDILPQTGRRL